MSSTMLHETVDVDGVKMGSAYELPADLSDRIDFKDDHHYHEFLIRRLTERYGEEFMLRTAHPFMHLGSGPDCIPIFDAKEYLDGETGRSKSRQIEQHVLWCIYGCHELFQQVIGDAIEWERDQLKSYIADYGWVNTERAYSKGQGAFMAQFPLLRKYPDEIWTPVATAHEPSSPE